ncbi:MAG: hypothetical protein OXT07_08370 [bacterium]|nr:hypothetical protein [bacterium]
MAEATTTNDSAASLPPVEDERLAHRGPVQQLLTRPEIGALIGAVGVWLLFWLVSETFGTAGGTANYLDVAATLGLMAVPVALLMIGGEFDLSSGSMTGATAVIVILLSSDTAELGGAGLSLHLAVPLSLAFALAIGWFNGTLVDKTSLPSFIVTLGTFFILIGAKLGFTKLFTNKVIAEGLDRSSGYEFWDNIFGARWVRNNHVWENEGWSNLWSSRDWAWSGLLIIGAVVLILGTMELAYARRERPILGGYLVSVFGAAVGAVGFIMLLNRDSTTSNWIFGAVTGAGVLVAVAGWCLARYQAAEREPVLSELDPRAGQYLIAGIVAIVGAVLIAMFMDSENADRLDFLIGTPGRAVLAIGIGATGVMAVLAALGRVSIGYPAIGAVVALVPGISYMVTVQGARAILFGGLAIAGVVLLSIAARRRGLAALFTLFTSVSVVGLAFFVRSEADSRKLRVELFTALLLIALILAASAVTRHIAARRSSAPPAPAHSPLARQIGLGLGLIAGLLSLIFELADSDGILYSIIMAAAKGGIVAFAVFALATLYRTLFTSDESVGRSLVFVGLGSVMLGISARLLFITNEELAVTRGQTRFGVGVMLFLAFAVLGAWVLARTQFGNWIFAVGGNKDASRSVGVPAARTKTTLFMLVSASAWVTGMVIAFRLNSVQADVGDGNEFRYIIVAVVGGCLLTGGYGSAIGAAIGAVIWGMITSGIGFATWNSNWRFLVLGALLLVAVLVNNYVRSQAEKVR